MIVIEFVDPGFEFLVRFDIVFGMLSVKCSLLHFTLSMMQLTTLCAI